MSAVRGCVDQYVVRFLLQAALDHCLQIFVFNLELLEGEVIHVNNELIIPVLDLRNHIVQVTELMFVHLDQTQSPVIILIGDRLYAGGFSSSGIAVKKTVVCFFSPHKSLRIVH